MPGDTRLVPCPVPQVSEDVERRAGSFPNVDPALTLWALMGGERNWAGGWFAFGVADVTGPMPGEVTSVRLCLANTRKTTESDTDHRRKVALSRHAGVWPTTPFQGTGVLQITF